MYQLAKIYVSLLNFCNRIPRGFENCVEIKKNLVYFYKKGITLNPNEYLGGDKTTFWADQVAQGYFQNQISILRGLNFTANAISQSDHKFVLFSKNGKIKGYKAE